MRKRGIVTNDNRGPHSEQFSLLNETVMQLVLRHERVGRLCSAVAGIGGGLAACGFLIDYSDAVVLGGVVLVLASAAGVINRVTHRKRMRRFWREGLDGITREEL